MQRAAAAALLVAGAAPATEPVRIGWVYAMANAPVLIRRALEIMNRDKG